MTQPQLGRALGVGAPSISSWESGKIEPPAHRLDEYATFFASQRPGDNGVRLLTVDELTEEERRARAALAAELASLAAGTARVAQPHSLWHFPDGQPVRLVSGEIESEPVSEKDFADDEKPRESPRSKYASGDELNYIGLMAYADTDSLVELFGHIRAQNPTNNVQYTLASRLVNDDMQSHLVIVGGLGNREALVERVLADAGVPIRQRRAPDEPAWVRDGEIFELPGNPPTYFRPRFDDNGTLIEDVGFFLRARSPFNARLTLTVVSGVFTRGVYGAVRMLTDERVRDSNHDGLATLFPDSPEFAVVVRVKVAADHATVTPDINAPGVVRYRWSRP
ncbi:MAG: helix-turn-helix domain-containing protein [Actinomycetota bacterium]|nr:helix-turn-helix domain-containing protein [Actinomycetota bacterium]